MKSSLNSTPNINFYVTYIEKFQGLNLKFFDILIILDIQYTYMKYNIFLHYTIQHTLTV